MKLCVKYKVEVPANNFKVVNMPSFSALKDANKIDMPLAWKRGD